MKKVPMWKSLSSIPVPPGFTEKDMEAELDREVAAEVGNRPRRKRLSSTQVINDYQTVYRQINGKDAVIEHKGGGYYRINDVLTVQVGHIPKMTETLRKRL